MPKQITPLELQIVLDALTAFPAGASVEQINSTLANRLSHRTLQRRLALLVNENRLTCEGRGRATRYRLAPDPSYPPLSPDRTVAQTAMGVAESDFYPPLSTDGLAVRTAIRAPLQQRRPVGYQRAFLDAYRPNETFYLPTHTRAQLAAMGTPQQPQRPAGTYARHILQRLLIDLSWNSSRLEGNTYSLLETERLLQAGAAAEGRNALETQMILNHKAAIELLVEQVDDVGFNRYTILNLHALLAENLLADPLACGRLRTIPVGIGGTVYHPLEVPQLIGECFTQILESATAIADPFEQAFFAMVHLPYLQPFEDVNKRVSRLAANIPLIRDNLSPLSFVDVPEQAYVEAMRGLYELNRIELLRDVFVWAYERSCARYSAVQQSLGQPDLFRMRHKADIAGLVSAVVKGGKNKQQATTLIRERAGGIVPAHEFGRFVEVVETELMGLHEGNIARYRLRPGEYRSWKAGWM
ncbi:MAG: Fic family protein [Gammaproteobacteria bacterium]|nr:Fic family protein [Gammaproteobacteria bacterium]